MSLRYSIIFFTIAIHWALWDLHADEMESIDMSASIESGRIDRYETEGRDNLDGHGLYYFQFELEAWNWVVGYWAGHSEGSRNYKEYQYSIARGLNWREWEATFKYTHLETPGESNPSDDEVEIDLAAPELFCGIQPSAEWYYSFDAGGSWFNTYLRKEIEFVSDKISMTPFVRYGHNEGYIKEGHRDANTTACGVEFDWDLTPALSLEAFASYHWQINRDPMRFSDDASLRDMFNYGVSVSLIF